MVDEIWDRQYQAGRQQLNAGLDRAFAAIGREIGQGLAALHRIEWSSPWAANTRSSSKDVGCA